MKEHMWASEPAPAPGLCLRPSAACLPLGDAGNWIKGHSSDSRRVVIGNWGGGGRGRHQFPLEKLPSLFPHILLTHFS